MSKNNRHLQLVRSSEKLENGSPKLPVADDLVYGELALNFAKGVETLSTINSENEIITFPNNADITEINNKLDSTIVNITSEDNSVTVTSSDTKPYSVDLSVDLSGAKAIISDEYEAVEYPEVKGEIVPEGAVAVVAKDNLDTVAHKLDTSVSALTQEVLDVEEVVAKAIEKHNLSSGFDEHGEYTGNTEEMNYINNSTNITDALQILDGALKDVKDSGIVNITSEDDSISITSSDTKPYTVDLSAAKPIISDDYEAVEYPEVEGKIVPKDAVAVVAKDDLDTVAHKLDTSVSALTQEFLDAEEILTNAIEKHNLSSGFDEHGEYTGDTDEMHYINVSKNLTDAVQILDGVVRNIDNSSIKHITSKDKSITISATTNIVDLSAAKPIISDDYEPIEYPKYPAETGEIFPSGADPVVANDDLDTMANKIETTISSLTQSVIDVKNDVNIISGTVEDEIDGLLILTSAVTRMNESLGFTENIRYAPKHEKLKDFTRVTPAIDYLASVIFDLQSRIEQLEDKFDTY